MRRLIRHTGGDYEVQQVTRWVLANQQVDNEVPGVFNEVQQVEWLINDVELR